MTNVGELEADAAEALGRLYRRHASWLRRRLRAKVAPDHAEELVQETYLRVTPYTVADIRYPKSFLMRIAMNLLRDQSRKARRLTEAALPPQEEIAEPAQIDSLMLKQIILSMPALYRDVFVLSRFGGMTYDEIAVRTGVSKKTVEYRMTRALEFCMTKLDD